MNERPILFSAEMVRAIAEGRKTQTRRVILGKKTRQPINMQVKPEQFAKLCPYGQPGDRLWVRESMWLSSCGKYFARQCYDDPTRYPTSYDVLARDGSGIWRNLTWSNKGRWLKSGRQTKEFSLSWRNDNDKILEAEFRRRWPSIYMPRWASRLAPWVTNIRVERVQDITNMDAVQEGVDATGIYKTQNARAEFAKLWNDINGHPKPIYERVGSRLVIVRYESYPWDDGAYTTAYRGKPHHVYGNTWVWVVEFRKPANE